MNSLLEGLRSARAHFRQDLMASIVVFLVALPLCMGVAVASGVPPARGLITGIIGGLVVALFAGAPLQVSGPAAGLTVLVWELVQEHGLSSLGIVVLIAGLIQILAGVLRVGQWFRAVSPAVVHGMLAGIGVVIAVGQFHVMVDDKPRGSGLANIASIPDSLWKAIVPLDGSAHHLAALIGLLTIGIIVAWGFVPQRLKVVPAPLVAIASSSAIAAVFNLPIQYVQLPASLMDAIQLPSFGGLSHRLGDGILVSAVAIAVIASAETLLAATAVDRMHTGPRARYDKELIAQGLGNAICGLLGALPMTGVIVRSKANVEAGAKTRVSAMLHGFWLLLLVVAFPFVLSRIPTASLAAMLVYTGCKLVGFKELAELWKLARSEALIYATTMVAIVMTNLLEGVLIGLVLALLKLLRTTSRLDIRRVVSADGGRTDLHLHGSATFLRLPKLAAALETLPPTSEVHVHLDDLTHLDHACMELIHAWQTQHQALGGKLVLDGKALQAKFHGPKPLELTRPGHIVPS